MSKKKRRIKDLEFVDYEGCTDEKWEEYQQRADLYEYYCADSDTTYILRETKEAEKK